MSLNIFDLMATLRLDSSDYERGLDGAEKQSSVFGDVLKANLVSKGIDVAIDGFKKLGSTAVDIIKQSVDSYGEYQQLVGGVETLFGDSAGKVLADAQSAFKDAGMSMNDYMETSIQSAASLINSLGGDQAKAAELMNVSIVDMADNVNKMGTTMQGVQDAYRGFSRGNFTMLDNLALGFSGTKEGMQELLDKAEEFAAKNGEIRDFSIDSYADIVEAIHIVQTEMGITGTTANEASETIQGSIGALSSAWQNLVIGFSDPDADLGVLIDNVVQSGKVALENLLPTIKQALIGISQAIKEIAPIIADELPGLVEEVLPPIIDAATTLVAAIVTNLPTIISVLVDAMPMVIETIGNALVESWPALSEAIMEALNTTGGQVLAVVLGIVTAVKGYGIITGIMNIIGTIGSLGTSIMGLASSAMPVITEAVGTATTAFGGFSIATAGVVAGIGVCVAEIINGTNQLIDAHKTYETALQTHQSEIDSAMSNYAKLYNEKGKEIADQWAEMVYQIDTSNMSLEESQRAISQRIDSYWDGVPQNMWEGFKAGWNDYFGSGGKGLFALIGDAFSGAVDGVRDMLGLHSPSTVFADIGKNVVLGFSNGYNKNWNEFFNNIQLSISNVTKAFNSLTLSMSQIGSNLLISLGNGFMNAMGGVLDRVRSVGTSIVNAAKSVFGIASPSKVFTEIGRFIDEGLADGIMDGLSLIEDAADDMTDAVYGDDLFRDQDMQVVTTTSKSDDEPPTDSLIPTQGEESRDIVVILELDGVEVGRTVAPYINRESRRVGVQLAGGLA